MKDTENAGSDDLAAARARHLQLVLAGDRHAALRDAAAFLQAGVPLADFVLEVLAPVQAEVGCRWQTGALTTAQERQATDIAEILLTMAAGRHTATGDGANLVLCVADREHHNLPARMIAELLRHDGHAVTFLGAARPGPSLLKVLRSSRPDAVVVSCSITMNLPGIATLTAALHDAGLPVIGGGRAFGATTTRASRVGLDGLALRVADVEPCVAGASIGTLTQTPDDDRAIQHAELAAARHVLCDEITERLLWRAAPLVPRPLRASPVLRGYVSNLMRFVEAAVLCDSEILTEYLTWLDERMAGLRADPALVPTLVGLIHDRLAPDAPSAAAVLAAASCPA